MEPAESTLMFFTPISTLKGDLTVSPFFRFLKKTFAPAGTGGNAATDFIVSADECLIAESVATAAAAVSEETDLLSLLLHDIIAMMPNNKMKQSFSIFKFCALLN